MLQTRCEPSRETERDPRGRGRERERERERKKERKKERERDVCVCLFSAGYAEYVNTQAALDEDETLPHDIMGVAAELVPTEAERAPDMEIKTDALRRSYQFGARLPDPLAPSSHEGASAETLILGGPSSIHDSEPCAEVLAEQPSSNQEAFAETLVEGELQPDHEESAETFVEGELQPDHEVPAETWVEGEPQPFTPEDKDILVGYRG